MNDPAQEEAYMEWITSTPWFQEFWKRYGEQPDLNSKDYDYRAAYRAGMAPQRDPYDSGRYHWPSAIVRDGVAAPGGQLKAKNHPTAWMDDYMGLTGRDPRAGGQQLNSQQIEAIGRMLTERYGR